jgi:subtilase family serine protease
MPGRRMAVAITGTASLIAATLVTAGAPAAAKSPGTSGGARGARSSQERALDASPRPVNGRLVHAGTRPPTDAQCRAATGMPCYSPQEIRHAYGVDRLLRRGYDGKGETIVIVDSFGSPTIASDLKHFDAGYGLPAPPSFKILAPLGSRPGQLAWAGETTLDVEWAHAMAPDAGIVLMTSPVNETEGVQGMPQFNALENYALDHHLGQVISQSWGATENTLFTSAGRHVLQRFQATYTRAAAMHVTVLASTGDSGSSNPRRNGTLYPFPTVNFPASSPLVTAVGGTSLHASTSGVYRSETVWNSDGGATGGGISQAFAEPLYQRFLPAQDQALLGGHRGIPDISWNADPSTSILVYLSFLGPQRAGYYSIGGTSEGAPDWAGLVADLDQLAGHPIGLLNPYLYALGAAGVGYHDITVGNNASNGVPGYSATPGWDAATGWGSPDLGQLIPDIAFLARGDPSRQALLTRARSLRGGTRAGGHR